MRMNKYLKIQINPLAQFVSKSHKLFRKYKIILRSLLRL